MIQFDIETLKLIGSYVWLGYLIALTILFVLMLKTRRVGSSFITVLVVAVAVWFMDSYRDFMLLIMNNKELVSEYKTLIRYAWYFGFAAFSIAIIAVIWRVHVAFVIPYSYLTRVVIALRSVVVLIQLYRLLERQSFNSEIMTEIGYQWSIIIINIVGVGVALLFAFIALGAHLKKVKIRGVV